MDQLQHLDFSQARKKPKFLTEQPLAPPTAEVENEEACSPECLEQVGASEPQTKPSEINGPAQKQTESAEDNRLST